MTAMFHISDNDGETSDDVGDSEPSGVTHGNASLLPPNARNSGEPGGRVRMLSESLTFSGREDHNFSDGGALDEGGGAGGGGDGTPFRGRSQSAPPALWAAQRYGRQLRRMSDEFDTLLDKGMKRVRSAGAARQMQASPSWFAFLWSHKESETEMSSGLSDSRAAQ